MDWINQGAKFNPYVHQPILVTLQKFDDSFVDCTNKIFKRSFQQTKVLSASLQTNYTAKRNQLNHLHWLNYCPDMPI